MMDLDLLVNDDTMVEVWERIDLGVAINGDGVPNLHTEDGGVADDTLWQYCGWDRGFLL